MQKIKLFFSAKWPWIQEHLVSGLITFATGFCLVLYSQLQNLNVDKIEWASLWGLLLACVRAGFKMLIQQFIIPQVRKLAEYLKNKKRTI